MSFAIIKPQVMASSAARWWLKSGRLRALETMFSLNLFSWGRRFWDRIRVSAAV